MKAVDCAVEKEVIVEKDLLYVRYYIGDGPAKVGEVVDVVEVNGFTMVAIRQDSDPRYRMIYVTDIRGIYGEFDRGVTLDKLKSLLAEKKEG